ncbi:hypothetical protein Tco_0245884 [Tanacetum coccineum]
MIEEINKDENVNLVKSSELRKSHDIAEHRMESEHDDDNRNLAKTLLNIKRSTSKGKAIMQDSEPLKKIKKKEMVQISLDEEFAKSFYEEEQAQILQDEEYAKQVEAQWVADEERIAKETLAQAKQTDEREKVINWNDPDVLRYHAIQNRPLSEAEVWDHNHAFVPKDSEIEKEVMKRSGFDLHQEPKKAEGRLKRKTSKDRMVITKKQKTDKQAEIQVDSDQEEDEIKKYMQIVPVEEIAIDAIPLATKLPIIVDWKIISKGKVSFYHIIRADGSSKRYTTMIHLLQNIDREDLENLWKLVKAKYGDTRPEEAYEKVLWGDLKVMFEPDIESEVWRNLQSYDVIAWILYSSCGVNFVRFENLHIFMLVEKSYPLTPTTITKMLDRKLQADHYNEMCYQLLKLMEKQQKKK